MPNNRYGAGQWLGDILRAMGGRTTALTARRMEIPEAADIPTRQLAKFLERRQMEEIRTSLGEVKGEEATHLRKIADISPTPQFFTTIARVLPTPSEQKRETQLAKIREEQLKQYRAGQVYFDPVTGEMKTYPRRAKPLPAPRKAPPTEFEKYLKTEEGKQIQRLVAEGKPIPEPAAMKLKSHGVKVKRQLFPMKPFEGEYDVPEGLVIAKPTKPARKETINKAERQQLKEMGYSESEIRKRYIIK